METSPSGFAYPFFPPDDSALRCTIIFGSRIRKPGMNGAIDPVQLAVEACGRVVACKVHARKRVEGFEMLRKKHAVTGGDRGSKADGFGDLRLPLATSARVAKWIGK